MKYYACLNVVVEYDADSKSEEPVDKAFRISSAFVESVHFPYTSKKCKITQCEVEADSVSEEPIKLHGN